MTLGGYALCSSASASACLLVVFAMIAGASGQSNLRCWHCSTDMSNGEFCNDPFEPEYISDQQRYWNYVNCTYSVGVKLINARPVCKKLIQEVYGKRVVIRSCFYEDLDDPSDRCARETTSSNTKTVYCQTCNTDGCNGTTRPLGSYLFLIANIVILLKIFK